MTLFFYSSRFWHLPCTDLSLRAYHHYPDHYYTSYAVVTRKRKGRPILCSCPENSELLVHSDWVRPFEQINTIVLLVSIKKTRQSIDDAFFLFFTFLALAMHRSIFTCVSSLPWSLLYLVRCGHQKTKRKAHPLFLPWKQWASRSFRLRKTFRANKYARRYLIWKTIDL